MNAPLPLAVRAPQPRDPASGLPFERPHLPGLLAAAVVAVAALVMLAAAFATPPGIDGRVFALTGVGLAVIALACATWRQRAAIDTLHDVVRVRSEMLGLAREQTWRLSGCRMVGVGVDDEDSERFRLSPRYFIELRGEWGVLRLPGVTRDPDVMHRHAERLARLLGLPLDPDARMVFAGRRPAR